MISASDILRDKVLIVDDKKVNVLLLERMLRAAGYASVTSTMDPGEVCELHLKNRYDLILLDLQESYLETIFTMTRAAEHKDYFDAALSRTSNRQSLRSWWSELQRSNCGFMRCRLRPLWLVRRGSIAGPAPCVRPVRQAPDPDSSAAAALSPRDHGGF